MSKLKILCEAHDFSAIESAFRGEKLSDCPLSAEIALVSAEEIKALNAQTRGIDAVTDVLSYPSLDDIRGVILKKRNFPADLDEDGNLFLGSIAICVSRAEEQAEEYGHSFERELNYLAVHGLFHLLGYDHMTDSDKRQMREREEYILGKAKLTR